MTDTPKQRGRRVPPNYSGTVDAPARMQTHGAEAHMVHRKPQSSAAENGYDFDRLFSAGEEAREDIPISPGSASDKEFTRFQDRLRRGKVKLCRNCGGVMKRSSRMVLSSVSAILLVALGALLLAGYGLAINFSQPPWYVRYALPAMYYIGALHVGIGILLFFIRERIWYCADCKGIDKR